MAKVVERRKLNFWEELYLPAIVDGLGRTFRQMFKPEITLQYPEQRPVIADDYRGAPGLVKDEEGREKCVSCQLCEYICPPKAIVIEPGEVSEETSYDYSGIEKAPQEFYIDMLRCIYCGYCEEICPEQAIFMTGEYELNASTRQELVFDKARLYKLGGTRPGLLKKWKHKDDGLAAEEH
ncbi:MAG: NADH-quinone oxidoreductase subunit I [Planctomycetota bacterium]|jgi:NADH-quinone oxidoreductase subunit I|nr:NADH-quinone oxidoreductase subunit I [Planctomycetota bacterium]